MTIAIKFVMTILFGLLLLIFNNCNSGKDEKLVAVTTSSESAAIAILGEKRVISAGETYKAWGKEYRDPGEIPFADSILRLCAEENISNKASWWLVYVLGQSFNQMKEKRGMDHQAKPPAFAERRSWQTADSFLLNQIPSRSGYYLINLSPWYKGMKWNDQQFAISQNELVRADERVVAEVLFSVFMTRDTILLSDNYHLGGVSGREGHHFAVGLFSRTYGLMLDLAPDERAGANIGVVLEVQP